MKILNKPNDKIDFLKDLLISKIWIWLVLVFALYLFYQLILSQDLFLALGIALFPFLIILFIVIIAYSEKGFYPIFISHFILFILFYGVDVIRCKYNQFSSVDIASKRIEFVNY